jgi:prevent-host-death family protein
MKSTWQVQEAKNKFSQVLDQAATEPQVITRHGRKAGVLMSYETYRKRVGPPGGDIRALYSKAPKFEAGELDFQSDRDTGREIQL